MLLWFFEYLLKLGGVDITTLPPSDERHLAEIYTGVSEHAGDVVTTHGMWGCADGYKTTCSL